MKLRHHHNLPPRSSEVTTDRLAERTGERGASLVEYGLLLALIAIVAFGAVSFFGDSTEGGFGKSKRCIEAAHAGQPIPAECS